jgi:hypothetical protein
VTIGLTDYAQSSLGGIVHMDVPEVGSEFKKEIVSERSNPSRPLLIFTLQSPAK